MQVNLRKILKLVRYLFVAYIIIGILLYFLQEKFLFHPTPVATKFNYNFKHAYAEIYLPVMGDSIHLVKFNSVTPVKKGLVLYFHGNMKNVGHYADFVSIFIENGYEVWMPDYPSFGKSTGKINEKKLWVLADSIKTLAQRSFADSNIILYGKSLGTGLASYAAQIIYCKKVILETPYYSIPSLFNCYAPIYPCDFLSIYRLPSYKYIQQAKMPVTIFHGTKDGVVPYRNAKRFINILKPKDTFITVTGADHKNINSTEEYLQNMEKLLR
jgi:uncharacterized protein